MRAGVPLAGRGRCRRCGSRWPRCGRRGCWPRRTRGGRSPFPTASSPVGGCDRSVSAAWDCRGMIETTPVLGLLGGLVGIACTVPYVRDTVSGATRPHRGTWLIWGVLAVVACVSQRADGASWSLALTGSQAVLTALVFVLAIRHGEGGLTRVDLSLMSVAGAGVVGWLIAHDPVI